MNPLSFTPHPLMQTPAPRSLAGRGPVVPVPQPPAVTPASAPPPRADATAAPPQQAPVGAAAASAQSQALANAETQAPIRERQVDHGFAAPSEDYSAWAEAPDAVRRPGATQGVYLNRLFDFPAPAPVPPPASLGPTATADIAAETYDATRGIFASPNRTFGRL